MKLFNSLVDSGNTVIITEHNLDVIKQADWSLILVLKVVKMEAKLYFREPPRK